MTLAVTVALADLDVANHKDVGHLRELDHIQVARQNCVSFQNFLVVLRRSQHTQDAFVFLDCIGEGIIQLKGNCVNKTVKSSVLFPQRLEKSTDHWRSF